MAQQLACAPFHHCGCLPTQSTVRIVAAQVSLLHASAPPLPAPALGALAGPRAPAALHARRVCTNTRCYKQQPARMKGSNAVTKQRCGINSKPDAKRPTGSAPVTQSNSIRSNSPSEAPAQAAHVSCRDTELEPVPFHVQQALLSKLIRSTAAVIVLLLPRLFVSQSQHSRLRIHHSNHSWCRPRLVQPQQQSSKTQMI